VSAASGLPGVTPGPVRTCVGCRARAAQATLLRLAWDEAVQAVVVDQRRRLPGRGAWLHPDQACLDQAVRRKAIGRALRRPVAGLPVGSLAMGSLAMGSGTLATERGTSDSQGA
jgi:predicted RNA-binding protein YlxR (DUF448 family)